MPEPPGGDLQNGQAGEANPLIFVSDASAEAERLTAALRARGYSVVDVPLALLVGRVAVQRPSLILCDVDADGALETTNRLRDVPGGSGLDIIFLGEAGRTLESMADAVVHEGSAFFVRPVDTYALLSKVEALVGPPVSGSMPPSNRAVMMIASSRPPGGAPSSPPPPASAQPISTIPPRRGDEGPPLDVSHTGALPASSNIPREQLAAEAIEPKSQPLSDPKFPLPSSTPPVSVQGRDSRPSSSGPPSLPPPVPLGMGEGEAGLAGGNLHATLSPELESLLNGAEQRIASESSSSPSSDRALGSGRLSPEDEVDAVLPADVLASLDEPLDDESEEDDELSDERPRTGSGRTGHGTGEGRVPPLAAEAPSPESASSASTTGLVTGAPGVTGTGLQPTGVGVTNVQTGVQEPLPGAATGTGTGQHPDVNLPKEDPKERATKPPPPRPSGETGGFDDAPATPRAKRPPTGELILEGLPPAPLHAALPPNLGMAERELPPPTQAGFTIQEHGAGLPEPPATTREPSFHPSEPPSPERRPTPLPPSPGPQPSPPIRESTDGLPPPPPVSEGPVTAPRAPMLDAGPISTTTSTSTHVKPEADDDSLNIPAVLSKGDAARALAEVIRKRFSGALAVESDAGIRRMVLRDGDFVLAASAVHNESLLAFLVQRGDLSADLLQSLGRRLPAYGRHAGAALIAHGHLRQDDLWPVLRSHAEWLLATVIGIERGSASASREIPPRLEAEPAVFGGATGAEVFVEVMRRAVSPSAAIEALGGSAARLTDGPHPTLLSECALSDVEQRLVSQAKATQLSELLDRAPTADLPAVLLALVELGVLEALAAPQPVAAAAAAASPARDFDQYDEDALRARVRARRALVDEGDYFALLGVSSGATGYDIRRAYLELRREFEPSRALTANTADLLTDVELIVEVIDEAYDILKDDVRRERYRRAILAKPMATHAMR